MSTITEYDMGYEDGYAAGVRDREGYQRVIHDLEARNRAMLETMARWKSLEPPPPIIVRADAIAPDLDRQE